ncbi:MAG: AIR synthase-related protein, partial [Oscillospiraceae bacterium]|nr:AIR synthase-related protein [Oscillospiraceae bacterium]
MSMQVYRCYVEKKPGFDVPTQAVRNELSEALKLPHITVRIFNRYDIEGVPGDKWQYVMNTVLSEPVSDIVSEELPEFPEDTRLLYVQPLPGQFDMRADSCEQCVQMLLGGVRPVVKSAKIYAVRGADEAEFERIKAYLINPLENMEASADKPETLSKGGGSAPEAVPVITGMRAMDGKALEDLHSELEMAMSKEDLKLIQKYFTEEKRDPTLSELRVLDTYWSDHCRHTTFNTIIDKVNIEDGRVKKAYDLFLGANGGKPTTLMNIATVATRYLMGQGKLPNVDVSEENNACTVHVKVDFEDGRQEDWLLFFKNETHNHPTEIEPFGGASTCIGGAIRDPLSGRSYVYQAMRITGSADPRMSAEDALPGKLPQRKITVTAAQGYSSYGNQIGLATGFVKELYHEGYVAKRLEVGAVVGAAPKSNVRRERPAPGDVVVLLGGRTGRDGVGGATGSSKTHNTETVSESASEVQKGNAPEERKIQRLFRDPNVTKLIKKCNDFGAGGISVAVGELADGMEINLDVVPVKYDGLNGTELAISESQERMAVVVARDDQPALFAHAEAENIQATVIAEITEQPRLVMNW